MTERLPPDDGDDLFEWTTPGPAPREPRTPASASSRAPPGAAGTGERDRTEPSEAAPPSTGEEDPLATGERRAPRLSRPGRRSDTEERRRVRGDTGEFERSGRRPPPGRRSRHRDLPARVRRRQAIGIGAVALVLVVALIALVSGGGDGEEEQPLAVKRWSARRSSPARQGEPDPDLVRQVGRVRSEA
jgi:hypothetical protein